MGKVVDLRNFTSVLLARAALATRAGKSFENARDTYKSLGYDRTLDFDKFIQRYKREGIATRVVDAYPNATWRFPPKLVADDAFVKAWEDLVIRLSIFHYLERLDKLAGIGRYAVLLVGTKGGAALRETLTKVRNSDDLIYLSVYHEGHAEIKKYENDHTKETFGLPLEYQLTLITDSNGASSQTRIVNASRLIHAADNVIEDDIFGVSRLERVWNYLDDLVKIHGATAEAIWRISERGIQFNVDKDAELKTEDEEALVDEINEYMHDFKRYMLTQGVEANVLGSESIDPRGAFEVTISLISGATSIPQRILTGSERGQLASGQDERNFGFKVKERQTSFAETKILRPFVDKLINIGALPNPSGGYEVEWPDIVVLSEKEKADIAARYGQSINHVAGQTKERQQIVTAKEFREKFLGLEGDVIPDEIIEPEVEPEETPEIIEDSND